MTKVKVEVKEAKEGKAGTKVASGKVVATKTDKPTGRGVYRTRAQIHARIRVNKNGQSRKR